MFFWLAKMIWMMAPIGRGGKGRAFPPVSISQWGQRADQRCFLSPTLTPVLPPSLRPRYLANRSKRHTTHALTSTSHGEPSAESQRPQGPRQRAGWAPDTHTRWGDTPAPSCICTNTHTQTHRLTLNGHIKLSFSLSPTHTHPHLHTHSWFHTHVGDDVLTPSEGCTPSKEEAYFLSTVVLEVEGVAHDKHISTSPVNHDSK